MNVQPDYAKLAGYVYKLVDPTTGEVRYIGQTCVGLRERLRQHINKSYNSNTHVANWIKSLRAKGVKPVIELIEKCSIDDLDSREIHYINYFRESGAKITNLLGGGQKNRVFTDEVKAKISNSLKGKKQSEESNRKRIESLKETWSCEKLRELKRQQTKQLFKDGILKSKAGVPSPKKGRPFCGDKQKLKQSLKIFFSDASKRNDVAVRNGQKEFDVYNAKVILRANRFRKQPVVEVGDKVMSHVNVNEVARIFNLHPNNIRKCLHGKRSIVGNYTFKYIK